MRRKVLKMVWYEQSKSERDSIIWELEFSDIGNYKYFLTGCVWVFKDVKPLRLTVTFSLFLIWWSSGYLLFCLDKRPAWSLKAFKQNAKHTHRWIRILPWYSCYHYVKTLWIYLYFSMCAFEKDFLWSTCIYIAECNFLFGFTRMLFSCPLAYLLWLF